MKVYLTLPFLLLPVSTLAQTGIFREQQTLTAAEAAARAPAPANPASLIETLRFQVLQSSNKERARVGLPPLTYDPVLDQAAARYSRKMQDLNFFDHVAPDGETLSERLPSDKKWRFQSLGENLWSGKGALDWRASYIADKAAANWVESPGHRANLFSPDYTLAGVGSAMRGDEIYITMLYGTPVADENRALLQRDFGTAPANLTAFLTMLETVLAKELNAERARAGLLPLRSENNLVLNSRNHAQKSLIAQPAGSGVLDEVFRLDRTRTGRLAAGFWRGSGALIWQAEQIATDILNGWRNSQTGLDILDPEFDEVGVGTASDGNTIQVTVVFG